VSSAVSGLVLLEPALALPFAGGGGGTGGTALCDPDRPELRLPWSPRSLPDRERGGSLSGEFSGLHSVDLIWERGASDLIWERGALPLVREATSIGMCGGASTLLLSFFFLPLPFLVVGFVALRALPVLRTLPALRTLAVLRGLPVLRTIEVPAFPSVVRARLVRFARAFARLVVVGGAFTGEGDERRLVRNEAVAALKLPCSYSVTFPELRRLLSRVRRLLAAVCRVCAPVFTGEAIRGWP
jgi:hypothetical protein